MGRAVNLLTQNCCKKMFAGIYTKIALKVKCLLFHFIKQCYCWGLVHFIKLLVLALLLHVCYVSRSCEDKEEQGQREVQGQM